MDTNYTPGDRVYRNVLVGQDGSFDITDPQPLTVVRVNRVTVTVRTDEGSEFRMDPDDILGRWTFDQVNGHAVADHEFVDDIMHQAECAACWDTAVARGHADKYPNGCREPGHSCDACLERLGQDAHPVISRRVGARKFYNGTFEYRCTVPGCKAEM